MQAKTKISKATMDDCLGRRVWCDGTIIRFNHDQHCH